MKLYIGTSGFSYAHWKGIFYPSELSPRAWLEFYASQFNTVEINSTFYHLPRPSVLTAWYHRTPAEFTFVLKGSRVVTHRQRLKDCRTSVERFYERALLLREKLGAVLWQLPPGLACNCSLLEEFLSTLPTGPLAVLEFRHQSWYRDDVYTVLRTYHSVLCIHDIAHGQSPDVVISPTVYLRFHGTSGRYRGGYSHGQLSERTDWILGSGVTTVYAFFNNDIEGHAVRDAVALRNLLQARLSRAD